MEKSGALFGQATYTPSGLEALHLTAGGRVESDYAKQRGTFTQFGPATVVLLPQSSNTWHAGTYKAEIGYDLTDNHCSMRIPRRPSRQAAMARARRGPGSRPDHPAGAYPGL